MTPLEQSLIELLRQTAYGSITIHIQDNKIVWIDDNKRHSPEVLLTKYPPTPIL